LAGIGEPMVPTFGGLANIDPQGNRTSNQIYENLSCFAESIILSQLNVCKQFFLKFPKLPQKIEKLDMEKMYARKLKMNHELKI
jgi:hypothetical protein